MTATRKPRRIVSRAEFARIAGVSRSAVTKASRVGGPLHPATTRTGDVNLGHPSAQRWLAARGQPRPKRASEPPREPPEATPAPAVEAPDEGDEGDAPELVGDDLAELASLTLAELDERHANVSGLRAFLRARRDLESARKEILNRLKLQGRLIPARSVELAIGHIDAGFRLALTTLPRTVATRIAPSDQARCAAIVRDALEQILENAKQRMIAALEAADPLASPPLPEDAIVFAPNTPPPAGYSDTEDA